MTRSSSVLLVAALAVALLVCTATAHEQGPPGHTHSTANGQQSGNIEFKNVT